MDSKSPSEKSILWYARGNLMGTRRGYSTAMDEGATKGTLCEWCHESHRPTPNNHCVKNRQDPTTSSGVCGSRYYRLYGAPGGIRTHNLLIRSQALYPLSYGRAYRTFYHDTRHTASARSASRGQDQGQCRAKHRAPRDAEGYGGVPWPPCGPLLLGALRLPEPACARQPLSRPNEIPASPLLRAPQSGHRRAGRYPTRIRPPPGRGWPSI